MFVAANNTKNRLLASQARELFTDSVGRALPELSRLIFEHLSNLVGHFGSAPEMQQRRDAMLAYKTGGAIWVEACIRALKRAQTSEVSAAGRSPLNIGKLELMGEEVMEIKILSARLALRLLDLASWEFNDLRLRVQSLQGIAELAKSDILRPETLADKLLEQWTAAKLSPEMWLMVSDIIHTRLADHFLDSYHAVNKFLVERGVMAEIDLRPLVKRTPSAASGAHSTVTASASGSLASSTEQAKFHNALGSAGAAADAQLASARGWGPTGTDDSNESLHTGGNSDELTVPQPLRVNSPQDETRMQTATSPIARARVRAQGVLGQLKRLLSNQVAGFDDTRASPTSPKLAQAFSDLIAPQGSAASDQVYNPAQVEEAADALRQQTISLKKAASTSSEKATIEVVALMFQSILAEDRIPPTIRVWFARLQMPVLRVAILEPDFFGSLEHPARRLIDRMGSCVLGFDVGVTKTAMEVEIKRVVQVIEQYPETGRRVFQLVYDEFQNFLSKFLSEQGATARVVSIAQQMEQKETMAIQFTIEMRRMLNDLPVRDEVCDFLFKVWAEVLAIAAMRKGPQHAETVALKRAAADLVWAASAKPNRVERAKVIADLPKLLQLLRQGMSLLGLEAKVQDGHIKIISDTLADAFLSKTDVIANDRIDAIAQRLSHLEDYLSDEDVGELPLDSESLVMMIGIDASDIEVIAEGGSQPTVAILAWAQEIQIGTQFSLDHNNRMSQVQFAWRSDSRQLYLFASADGRNFLIQARRLAAYLQAGLLVPTEEEALTVRATREALAKLDANPERLLG